MGDHAVVLTGHYQQKGNCIKRRKPSETVQKIKGREEENGCGHSHQ
jgi:hypothetical protein